MKDNHLLIGKIDKLTKENHKLRSNFVTKNKDMIR